MSKPAVLAVDDDPVVSAAITRDLQSRYSADCHIVRATSGPEALAVMYVRRWPLSVYLVHRYLATI